MTRTVFRGGRLFDGTGTDPAPADVAIEGERIDDVGTGLDGDKDIDVSGRTLLPGLFDCHTHVTLSDVDAWRIANTPFSYQFFEAVRNLAATLRIGITTVRDAGGADLGVKQAVADGLIPGPRLKISITLLSQSGGHGDDWFPSGARVPLMISHPGRPEAIVDGPDEMRRRVRQVIAAGADVIKVATSGGVVSPRSNPRRSQFVPSELDVLVEEATAAGIYVMAHAQAAAGIKNAIRAGIRSIEHGVYLDDEAIDLMLERGTWLVPTLMAPQGVIDAAESGAPIPANIVEKAHMVVDAHRASFRKAVEAGVKVAMGTDTGVTPHGENLRELPLMATGGMSPAQVLSATTKSAAELLGLAEELGTVEPGKRADLVIVDGDPFDLGSLAGRITGVWQDGREVLSTVSG